MELLRRIRTLLLALALTVGCHPSTAGGTGPRVHPGRASSYRGLQAEMRRVPVNMYLAEWCPVCQRARQWLSQHGFHFIEHDIDQSDAARRTLRALNPEMSVPTFEVVGPVLVGFSPSKLARLIAEAAERRSARLEWLVAPPSYHLHSLSVAPRPPPRQLALALALFYRSPKPCSQQHTR